MRLSKFIPVLLLVLLIPIGWLGYWTTAFDDLSFEGVLVTPSLSNNPQKAHFAYCTYKSEPTDYRPGISFVRTLNLETGELQVTREEGYSTETALLYNNLGTRLNLQSIDSSPNSSPATASSYRFSHAEDSVIQSDASLETRLFGQRVLTDSDKLLINSRNFVQVFDVRNDFRLIGELRCPPDCYVDRILSTSDPDVFAATQCRPILSGYQYHTGLYRIGKDGLVELSKWQHEGTRLDSFADCISGQNDAFYYIATSSSEVQVRSLVDGQIIRRIPIDKALTGARFRVNRTTPVTPVIKASGQQFLLSAERDELIPINPTDVFISDFVEETGHHLLVEPLPSGMPFRLLTVAGNGETVGEYTPDFLVHHVQQESTHRNHLIVLGRAEDMRVDIVEINDRGNLQLLRSYRPLTWLRPYQFALLALLLVWFGLARYLISQSSRSYLSCIVMVIGLLALVFAALHFRALATGNPRNPFRLEYQLMIGLGLALTALSAIWLVFGKTRWGLRLVAPLSVITTLLAIVYLSVGNRGGALASMTFLLSSVTFGMVAIFSSMKRFGYRIILSCNEQVNEVDHAEAMDLAHTQTKGTVHIRDIFLITAIFALLFSVVRFTEGRILPEFDRKSIYGLLLIFSNGVIVTLIALTRMNLWFKWLWIVAMATITTLIYSLMVLGAFPGTSRAFEVLKEEYVRVAKLNVTYAIAVAFVMIGSYRQGLRIARQQK